MNKRILAFASVAWLAASAFADTTPESTVALAFVGDVMLADGPGKLIRRGIDPLRHVAKLIDTADVRIANLECVIASNGRAIPGKPWVFRAHPRSLKIVQRHFDAVSLANNHSGDFGPVAFAQMLDRLEAGKVAYFGGGRDLRSAHQPLIIEKKGLRIALLGYNEFLPRSFEAGENQPGVAWSEDEQVRHDITEARLRYRADLVIPFMHWGWENESVASQRQHTLARLMIDAGADAVIGGHPHVVQDTAVYQGKPIVFSLGNFVFDGFDHPENNLGWLLRLEVNRQGVTRWRVFPANIDRDGSPHPNIADPGLCWEAGMTASAACPEN